jgi:hypothetical protein
MSGGITTCPFDTDDLDVWAEGFIVREQGGEGLVAIPH